MQELRRKETQKMTEENVEGKAFHRERAKDRSSGRYRKTSPGGKLKNERSADKAMRGKIRHGRSDIHMTDEERKALIKKQVQGRKALDREIAVRREIHHGVSDADEDNNAGTEALNKGSEMTENSVSAAGNRTYSKKLRCSATAGDEAAGEGQYSGSGGKLGGNAKEAYKRAGGDEADAGSTPKAAQKSHMKKEFQRYAEKKSEAEAANQIGSTTKKFADKAEDLMGRLGEWVAESVTEHPVAMVIIAVVLIVALLISGFASGSGLLASALGHSTVESSYTAEDSEILATDSGYKAKEEELQMKLDNVTSDYPGYDEYRYSLDDIDHDPYKLAALLTVLYEDYTESEVQDMLQEIFEKQYKLTIEPVTEIRTRMEERKGTRTVYNEDGTTGTEEYTYEEKVEYEYHILNVTLRNVTLESVISGLGLTDDQKARYELLEETMGNKAYLFGVDETSSPGEGEYSDYEIPAEELTDTQFAKMISEAEKYLGMEYVWGGSSPSTGFDCSGFVSYVINHCGNGWSMGRQTTDGLLAHCTKVSSSEVQPGDLVFFEGTYDTSGTSHVGIYVGNGMMIHCGNPIKYSSIETSYWQQHFYAFGRING